MLTFNYKKIDSDARCQNYVEGYKPTDAEILAFYINHREDISRITEDNTDDTYKRLIYGNGIYFLFNDACDNEELCIYIGRSTQGVNRCSQHINKAVATDAKMYDKWDHVIFFTGAVQDWSIDNIYDLERLFIGFFKSDGSKWTCLNTQNGNAGTSDIGELNTKIVAILSFLSQNRYGLRLEDVSKTRTIVDKYLEETARSALEIRLEAERLVYNVR